MMETFWIFLQGDKGSQGESGIQVHLFFFLIKITKLLKNNTINNTIIINTINKTARS